MNIKVTFDRSNYKAYVQQCEDPIGQHIDDFYTSWVVSDKGEATQILHRLKMQQIDKVCDDFNSNIAKLQKL